MKLTSKMEIWACKTKKMRQLSNVVQHKINISTSKSFNTLYVCGVNGSIKFQGLGSCFRTGSVLSLRPRRILTVPVLWLTWTLYSHYVYGRLYNIPNKEMEGILFMKCRAFCKELRSTHRLLSHKVCKLPVSLSGINLTSGPRIKGELLQHLRAS